MNGSLVKEGDRPVKKLTINNSSKRKAHCGRR
jgi:hypothetical protein